jgi:hypothetical protein
MAETTIPVSRDVKELLEEQKDSDETWNNLLRRLAGETTFVSEEEARSIARAEAKDMIRQYGR